MHAEGGIERQHVLVEGGQPRHDALFHHHEQEGAEHEEQHKWQHDQPDHAGEVVLQAALVLRDGNIYTREEQQQEGQGDEACQQQVDAQPCVMILGVEEGREQEIG